jgi:ATP-dependent exoDNAse (exonuclease V) beta subunit
MKNFFARWRSAERNEEAEREFFVALVTEVLGNLRGGDAIKEVIEEYTGNLGLWRKSAKQTAAVSAGIFNVPPYGGEERRTRDMLNGSAALFWKLWDEARLEKGVLSFSDFARYGGEALAANRAYASRFRHIMVDEFQDTDELQDAIIRSLADSWPGESGAARTVFIVGDIKQSIYRFRYANPRLFAGYMNSASRISMPCSYRMNGALMDGVNMVFAHIWERGVIGDGSLRVAYEALLPPADAPWWGERNGAASPDSPMEILLYDPARADNAGEPEKENIGVQRKKLAYGIAAKLRAMIEGETKIWDKGILSFRPVKWRDVAILARSRNAYTEIEEAFDESGIP